MRPEQLTVYLIVTAIAAIWFFFLWRNAKYIAEYNYGKRVHSAVDLRWN